MAMEDRSLRTMAHDGSTRMPGIDNQPQFGSAGPATGSGPSAVKGPGERRSGGERRVLFDRRDMIRFEDERRGGRERRASDDPWGQRHSRY